MLLYYIRHGDPIYNPDSLTPQGHMQAEALSKRLANSGVEEIYCSPSMRARQTAAPTANLLNLPVTILDWCDEAVAWEEFTVVDNVGKWWFYQDDACRKAMATPHVQALGNDWCVDKQFADTRAADGLRRVSVQTHRFLSSLGYDKATDGNYYVANNPNDRRVALFAHEGFGMVFLSTLLGIPYPTFCLHFGLEHSGMTVIDFEGTDFVVPCVLQLSNDSHLYKEGLSTKFNNVIKI